ncbi:MAG: hypothetical protein Q8J78_14855 [Moraxellaceae bacterium]|nr:hypothetical protein [Moraxellaceae bacterium]
MKWLRLPVGLGLLWAIWFGWPAQPWQLPEGAVRIASSGALKQLSPGTIAVLDGRVWPLPEATADAGGLPRKAPLPQHDGAFIYERWLRYKTEQGGWTTHLFDARQPAFRLVMADGSTADFSAGAYRENATGRRHNGLAQLLPAEGNARLRLAPALAAWSPGEKPERLAAERHSRGFRPGDMAVVYTVAGPVLRATEMASGPFEAHATTLTREGRNWWWLSIFLRLFFSLFALGILAGLWKNAQAQSLDHPADARPANAGIATGASKHTALQTALNTTLNTAQNTDSRSDGHSDNRSNQSSASSPTSSTARHISRNADSNTEHDTAHDNHHDHRTP